MMPEHSLTRDFYPTSTLYSVSLLTQFYTVNVKDKWWPEMQYYNKGTPFLLVGAKTDLRDSEEVQVRLKESCCPKYCTLSQIFVSEMTIFKHNLPEPCDTNFTGKE